VLLIDEAHLLHQDVMQLHRPSWVITSVTANSVSTAGAIDSSKGTPAQFSAVAGATGSARANKRPPLVKTSSASDGGRPEAGASAWRRSAWRAHDRQREKRLLESAPVPRSCRPPR
jgi:hypothetical protein